MSGIFYGVGVGPGDPELMTLKAVRVIRENEIILVPGEDARDSVAYRIAAGAVPELSGKEVISVSMPMIKDRKKLEESHDRAADQVETYLREGKNAVFLTLGDPSVYSTFTYLEKRIKERGYATEIISGIPSFCAAAACAGIPLTEWSQELHILPALHCIENQEDVPGTVVLMKSGRKMGQVKKWLLEKGRKAVMVENCGMDNQKIYRSTEEIPEDAGYYSLIIAKEEEA